uniref:Large ribosomal subunit protein bL21c n=1 Tax=Cryptogramma acrostichoides TaxID=414624 RepID=A0A3G5CSD3_9MONI|nr:ribosomal protein L21 [Cryptogramma acrostichoides]AYW15774.1 ribosomal protein L21 [Cryptogramma acrostichoides]
MEKQREKIGMDRYAIIDIGGNQLQVEPGRFHDIRCFAPNIDRSGSDTKVSMSRVLLIRDGSNVDIGYPWITEAVVRGRILHRCFEKKLVIQKIHSKKKTRRISGCRRSMIRFVIDSIHFSGRDTNNC